MKRRSTLAGIAMGVLVALLLGSNLVAAVEDSVSSEDNSAQSGTYTAGGAHDLRATTYATTFCAGNPSTWGEGPLPAIVQSNNASSPNVNLADPTTPGGQGSLETMCFYNNGFQDGDLVVSFDQISDREVGACADDEGASDDSCTDGAKGELAQVLQATFSGSPEFGQNFCNTVSVTKNFSEFDGSPQLLIEDLPPKERCNIKVSFGLQVTGGTNLEEAKSRAQTDRLEWDIVFTLRDPSAAEPE